ncbi:MAG: hypothetical protein ABIN25_08610 [Ginsengibacter sp.]
MRNEAYRLNTNIPPYKWLLIVFFIIPAFINSAMAQAEVAPWGNITGIRVGGQLMKFESSLRLVENNWATVKTTAMERQRPKYMREGNRQIITTKIDNVNFTERVEDISSGEIKVSVKVSSNESIKNRSFFSVAIPLEFYKEAFGNSNSINPRRYLDLKLKNGLDKDSKFTADIINFVSKTHKLQFIFDKPTEIIFKKNTGSGNKNIQVYIPLFSPNSGVDSSYEKEFTIKAAGTIDNKPVTFMLDTANAGQPFEGFGGNFRLQNPKADPQVIDYCLDNLRVAWGRVEFPWIFWQAEQSDDPAELMKDHKLNPRVQQAMDMAVRLGKMGIPIILSGWFPPQWAVVGQLNMQPVNGVWGNQLDSTKAGEIYKSITAYILYLKNNYGIEISLFSFNESDLGINVRQTAEEHRSLIKGLGAYFKSKGLATKMLLGDNSDATTYQFIYPALNDLEALQYIGAISFHSWRGWDSETLTKWHEAALKINKPLIVGEGSIDAAGWNYPTFFEEQKYTMEEINLYIRLLAICQPLTILQWQLTSDYSPLVGGGIFGNNEPLRPTQRFWNFKQLAATPPGLFAMNVKDDRADITCAALGDNAKKLYAIHLVNNGADRSATIKGLPSTVRSITMYVTDKNQAVHKGETIRVSKGEAKFHLGAVSYTTLVTE